MFGALLGGLTGGAGIGALGIGALIGGLSAKQRGGNFLKGALTGAALGGITGAAGAKYGAGGGLFGFGSKYGNLLPAAGILMGSEMMGQQEANRNALEGRRRFLDEEEERRIARLNKIAGYDVANSKNFLTPNKFFGLARGGIAQLPGYEMGGEVIEEMGEEVAMSEPHPMEGWHDMYSNMIGSGEIPSSMSFDEFMEDIVPQLDIDIPMAARGGRIHAKDGLWANIHAKRKRIAGGSGEKMRSPGSPGAPTAKALRDSKAGGGISDLDMRLGGASNGPGTGTSDDIPAMLSDGEFVVTAKAVENLGGGDRMLGAQRMYQMMNKLDPNSQTPAEMTTVGYA